MLTKRIIPCLDIKNGRTVKGINFTNIRDAGDPVELAKLYAANGADELVFLDITASGENRKTFAELVRQIAMHINIPFTVGGGISSVADASKLLEAGADKVSINSSAVNRPSLVSDLADEFGSQFVVVAIDTKRHSVLDGGSDWVYTYGGTRLTKFETVAWAKEVCERGAGELLLTSMNSDGVKDGFSIDITQSVSAAVNIPVIASGGAGSMVHFADVFNQTQASAALAASVFHFSEIRITDLKRYLHQNQIPVRL